MIKMPCSATQERFWGFFGVSLNRYLDELGSTGIFSFDVIKFDGDQVRRGYCIERDGSLRDFIQAKHGIEAVKLIEGLLG